VLVQEQEAFLLPGVKALETFGLEHALAPGLRLLWTPGPSPGACVLHAFGADAGGAGGRVGLRGRGAVRRMGRYACSMRVRDDGS
jgi:hypothetical protein